jgi:hypothetical protein
MHILVCGFTLNAFNSIKANIITLEISLISIYCNIDKVIHDNIFIFSWINAISNTITTYKPILTMYLSTRVKDSLPALSSSADICTAK